jgi:hypothetical protein
MPHYSVIHPKASASTIVNRWPPWDNPQLWLHLIRLLSAEWVLRRLRGLA